MEIGVDDLIRKMPLEERVYRLRCVEAWSMTIPWTGFPLAKLVELAKPLSSAKYLQMETFKDPSMAPGQRQTWYPWPYTEGLTIEEANNDLAFLVTGVYGKPAPRQMGAPIRLAVPWKYGFKSVKSIVRFTFTDKRPKSYWESLQAREYGFWANVNPAGRSSALEPGDRGGDRPGRQARADAAVQRLRRMGRRPVQGIGAASACTPERHASTAKRFTASSLATRCLSARHVRDLHHAVLHRERVLQDRLRPVLPFQPMRVRGDAQQMRGKFRIEMRGERHARRSRRSPPSAASR